MTGCKEKRQAFREWWRGGDTEGLSGKRVFFLGPFNCWKASVNSLHVSQVVFPIFLIGWRSWATSEISVTLNLSEPLLLAVEVR